MVRSCELGSGFKLCDRRLALAKIPGPGFLRRGGPPATTNASRFEESRTIKYVTSPTTGGTSSTINSYAMTAPWEKKRNPILPLAPRAGTGGVSFLVLALPGTCSRSWRPNSMSALCPRGGHSTATFRMPASTSADLILVTSRQRNFRLGWNAAIVPPQVFYA